MLPIEKHIEQLKPMKTIKTKDVDVDFTSLSEIFSPMFAKKKIKEKKAKLTELQVNYNNAVNAYIEVFVKKHDYEFGYWISGEVGYVACFIDQYYFNFGEIKYDIDKKVKKDLIFQWQDDCLAHPKKNLSFEDYAKGKRFSDIKIKK